MERVVAEKQNKVFLLKALQMGICGRGVASMFCDHRVKTCPKLKGRSLRFMKRKDNALLAINISDIQVAFISNKGEG